jgi:large subunit ribosomal protein L10
MGMTRQAKEEVVKDLAEKLARAKAGFVADFQGLNVESVSKIRRKLKAVNVEYRVVKNTLMKRALKGTPIEKLAELFERPKAVAFKYDEEYGAMGRAAKELTKEFDKLDIKAAFIGSDLVYGKPGVETMASLPTLAEARSQLLGVINAPASKLLATINAPASQLLSVVEAKIDKDKGGAA